MDGQSQKILNEATQTVVWSALTVGLILILLLAPGTIMCAVSWLMLGTPPTRLSFIGNTLFAWALWYLIRVVRWTDLWRTSR